MKKKLSIALWTAVGLLIVSGSVFAHHSNSVYDRERLVTITGTVAKFEFINPHQLIYLSVEDDKGNPMEWIALGGAPNQMRRIGWTSKTVQTGEQLTISGFRFRDGRPQMLHVRLVRTNGEELPTSDVESGFYEEFMKQHSADLSRYVNYGRKK
jgi:hypothetical protein